MERLPRDINVIVEEQVRRWEAAQERRSREGARHWPVITISRQYGARGATLGRLLCGMLGFDFWDHELVTEISRRTGIEEAMLDTLDEHTRRGFEVFLDGVLRGKALTEEEFTRQVLRLVRVISAHGAACIVGRGANYLLEPTEALRVRVVAPLEARVADLAKRHGFDEDEARRRVERVDRDRASFIRKAFNRDVEEGSGYDLLLNTNTFSLEECSRVICDAYQIRFGDIPKAQVTG